MKAYHRGQAPFTGGTSDGLAWWQDLTIHSNEHPLKKLAIVLFSIVPHAAEVERLFSSLGGVQSPRRCRLTVENFEALGKCRSNYGYQIWKREKEKGLDTHRKHAHMHTRETGAGINTELLDDLELAQADTELTLTSNEGED